MYTRSLQPVNQLLTRSRVSVRRNGIAATSHHYSTNPDQSTNQGESKPNWVPFYKAKYGNNKIEAPVLENQYTGNAFMQNYIRNNLPNELLPEVESDLRHFGHRVATDIHKLALECEFNKPYIRNNQVWGDGTNELVVCDAWNKQKNISAEEGLISIGYDRKKYGQWARLYQFSKLYLYCPSSGLYSCPLAMTDGAAKAFEELNLLNNPTFMKIFNRLTTRDPSEFWTSGQWMTEKGGGSDVAGGTETVAIPIDLTSHKLYGYKWFSSATDANMALALARIADDEGNVLQGGTGVTLFYVPVKDNDGPLNQNINIIRLKDKLGTRQLPTAELLLDGALAFKVSDEGRGIKAISHMLQMTRIHNALASSSGIQRAFSLARDYAQRRKAFGKKLIDFPLHSQTLARIDLVSKATFLFAFENVRILGLIESEQASDEDRLLFRILNPLAKLYNAKVAIPAISECIECIGGQGVMEDSGIPYLYRDSQILSIWEGTTSVLSMDVLRSILKTNGETVYAFRSNVKRRLEPVFGHDRLKDSAQKVLRLLDEIVEIGQNQPTVFEPGARDFAFSLSNIFLASLFLQNALRDNAYTNAELLALRFCNTQDLAPFITNHKLGEYSAGKVHTNQNLVMENYQN